MNILLLLVSFLISNLSLASESEPAKSCAGCEVAKELDRLFDVFVSMNCAIMDREYSVDAKLSEGIYGVRFRGYPRVKNSHLQCHPASAFCKKGKMSEKGILKMKTRQFANPGAIPVDISVRKVGERKMTIDGFTIVLPEYEEDKECNDFLLKNKMKEE